MLGTPWSFLRERGYEGKGTQSLGGISTSNANSGILASGWEAGGGRREVGGGEGGDLQRCLSPWASHSLADSCPIHLFLWFLQCSALPTSSFLFFSSSLSASITLPYRKHNKYLHAISAPSRSFALTKNTILHAHLCSLFPSWRQRPLLFRLAPVKDWECSDGPYTIFFYISDFAK